MCVSHLAKIRLYGIFRAERVLVLQPPNRGRSEWRPDLASLSPSKKSGLLANLTQPRGARSSRTDIFYTEAPAVTSRGYSITRLLFWGCMLVVEVCKGLPTTEVAMAHARATATRRKALPMTDMSPAASADRIQRFSPKHIDEMEVPRKAAANLAAFALTVSMFACFGILPQENANKAPAESAE